MYEAHYGFREKPFSLIPDPDFLYPSRGHKLALSLLQYGLSEQTGIVVISGEVGSGKTTLVRHLLKTAVSELVVGLISNTHAAIGDLMDWIPKSFDLDVRGQERVERYYTFVDFVVAQYAAGKRTVLIIDEAQNLGPSTLEELRMFSNINADKHFVLQLVLVGQPELKDTLKRPDLRQFAQRISVFYDLQPLDLGETENYIRHRLGVAGGSNDIFEPGACAAVYHYAFGTPRLINILCDLSLVIGYAEDRSAIDMDIVLEAADARQATGLDIFRNDPDTLTREQRKRLILKDAATGRPPKKARRSASV